MMQSIRIGYSIDCMTGESTSHIGVGEIHSPQTTRSEIFDYLEAADKPCLIAINEFLQMNVTFSK